MKLWTWQADETAPNISRVDPRRPGSYYDKCHQFRPAFEELWKKLKTDQLVWCYGDEEEAKSPLHHNQGGIYDKNGIPDDRLSTQNSVIKKGPQALRGVMRCKKLR